jgi:hypothetical protein
VTRSDQMLGKGRFGNVWLGDLYGDSVALKGSANKTALEDEGMKIQ